jgi:hypothetical protein
MSVASLPVPARRTVFFELPRELRDNVYNNLFQGVSLAFQHEEVRPDIGARLHYFYKFNGAREHQALPCWPFASRQMLAESLEQWYGGASCWPCFCRHGIGKASRRAKTVSSILAKKFCRLTQVRSFNAPNVDNRNGPDTNYILWGSQTTSTSQLPQLIVPRMAEHFVSYSVMDCFFKYLASLVDHPAKEIKLSLSISSAKSLTRDVGAVDLSHFETLGPRFDRVVFRIACPYSVTLAEHRLNATIYPKVQHEAVRVAKYLVGGDESNGWQLRDYLEPICTSSDGNTYAYEWHVEVLRRKVQQSGQMQFEGMHYCGLRYQRDVSTGYDYYRLLQRDANNRIISWMNDELDEILTL